MKYRLPSRSLRFNAISFAELHEAVGVGEQRRGLGDHRREIATGGASLQGASPRWIRSPCQATDSAERRFVWRHQVSDADFRVSIRRTAVEPLARLIIVTPHPRGNTGNV